MTQQTAFSVYFESEVMQQHFGQKSLELLFDHHGHKLVIVNFAITIEISSINQYIDIIDGTAMCLEERCQLGDANKARVVLIVLFKC